MVILIILATVTISAVFDENGLIKQAQKTKESAENFVQGEDEEMNKLLQEYANMMEEDVEIPEPEIDSTPPVVTVTAGGTTTNSITVSVQAVDNESGMVTGPKYTYYIKKSNEGDGSYQAKATNITNASYTFTGLEQETSYGIKVEVNGDNAGNVGKGYLQNQVTGKITGGITFGGTTWSNGQASITVSTSTGNQIQYQVNGTSGSWKNVENGGTITGLQHGQTVYARLYDGTNYGETVSQAITDTVVPVVTVTAGGTTTNSVTVSVQAKDSESGMKASPKYTYYIKKTSEGDGSYQAKATSVTEASYTFTGLEQETSYDVKIEVNGDNAGNVGAGYLPNQITGKLQGEVTFGEISWSSGKASVTVSTNTSYQIEYQINNTTEGSWGSIASGSPISNLQHGQTVYARLTDGTNHGNPTSTVITDTVAPTVTVTPGGTTTNSVTVSVQATDNESGMTANPKYTYYIKKTSEPDGSYQSKATGVTSTTYTFTGLTQETSYDVKVEVDGDNAGNVGTGTLTGQVTTKVPDGGIDVGAITFGNPTWASGTASVTVSTNTGMQIQYQVNGIAEGSWQPIANGGTVSNLQHGQTVYVRLTDGTNNGDYASASIVDGTPPIVSNITTGEITENSIAVTVTASDNESGLATSGTYKYYLNGEEKATSESNSYIYTGLTAKTQYTIKVEVYDKALNKGENTIIVSTTKPMPPEGVTIPNGFYYVGGKINEGVVISDNPEDEGKGTSHEVAQTLKGNQFVWVPVPDPSTMFIEGSAKLTGVSTTTDVYSRLRGDSGDIGTKPGRESIREPDLLSTYDKDEKYWSILGSSQKDMADKMVAEYKAMYESVKKYKGFYIGRYGLTGTIDKPTTKLGAVLDNNPYNWYELKKAATNVVSTEYAQSTMIYGCQWDETMSWLISSGSKTRELVYEDSTSWGNYKESSGNAAIEGAGTIQITGYSKFWNANNIYDLAGNCFEWTQEATGYYDRQGRGGLIGHGGYGKTANQRDSFYPDNSSYMYGRYSTRATMYVK